MQKEKLSLDLSQLSCQHLKGVGKRIAERLNHLGIHYVQDLLFHLPFRYQDRTRVCPIAQINPGEHIVIEGNMTTVSIPKGGRTRLLCQLEDKTGRLYLRFFYVNPLQRKTLQPGVRIRCFGEVRFGHYGLELIHPEYRIITQNNVMPIEEHLTPIYPTTEGLTQTTWRKLTDQALDLLTQGGLLHDIIPMNILQKLTFPTLKEALKFVHRPPPDAPVDVLIEGRHISQKRLVFEELLAHRLSLLHLKESFQAQESYALPPCIELTQRFIHSLPFQLTNAQKKVAEDIYSDLNRSQPMLRLVQGDVGSGKTVVAALAILQAVGLGYQAAVMAPTELLIEQHARTFKKWFESFDIHVVLLSGQLKTTARRETLKAIASGKADVVLGTHAIFQKNVAFSKLALIVIDEQHRFGVEQRAQLREKGVHLEKCPHQLIMTATPIPRTLAMSVYADLDCSIINELPPGRTPVLTRVVPNTRRDDVLERIRTACHSGRQAYWVCTLIEESDVMQCQAAELTAQQLTAALPQLKTALIHGRMKSTEKEQIMSAFKQGELHLLVATTVIEVGVDVPNASLMVIENAERLGLAQLHQLRGRIGRGPVESHCILMYQAPLSRFAKERLAVMRETTDGFKIAECDLKIRGPGEVLGTKQTGDISMRIADLIRDSHQLPMVQQTADLLQTDYPHVIQPLIKRWLGNKERFGSV
jgi:ATP-dependent DNA helicase RecG